MLLKSDPQVLLKLIHEYYSKLVLLKINLQTLLKPSNVTQKFSKIDSLSMELDFFMRARVLKLTYKRSSN